jgi:hypothetical protein
MEKKQLGTLLMVLGAIPCLWGIVKASVIGYYPDELVPQVIIPLAIGAALIWLGERMRKSAMYSQ